MTEISICFSTPSFYVFDVFPVILGDSIELRHVDSIYNFTLDTSNVDYHEHVNFILKSIFL